MHTLQRFLDTLSRDRNIVRIEGVVRKIYNYKTSNWYYRGVWFLESSMNNREHYSWRFCTVHRRTYVNLFVA